MITYHHITRTLGNKKIVYALNVVDVRQSSHLGRVYLTFGLFCILNSRLLIEPEVHIRKFSTGMQSRGKTL